MMNKRIVLVFTLAALVAAIAWRVTLLSAQASPRPAAGILQDSVPTSEPVAPTLEYKILVLPSFAASRRSLFYFGPIADAPPNLEDEINKLAEQGFVVENFQMNSGFGASPYGVNGTPDIAVLLKRAKK